jgi:hypothetical protein
VTDTAKAYPDYTFFYLLQLRYRDNFALFTRTKRIFVFQDNSFIARQFKNGPAANKPVWFIAFVSPDSFVMIPKVYASKFKATYQTFGTLTTPATETKSIGLPADAQLSAFFALLFIKYTVTINIFVVYRD